MATESRDRGLRVGRQVAARHRAELGVIAAYVRELASRPARSPLAAAVSANR
jgi:hypothetical protein